MLGRHDIAIKTRKKFRKAFENVMLTELMSGCSAESSISPEVERPQR